MVMNFDNKLHKLLQLTNEYATKQKHAFITTEHILLTLTRYSSFKEIYTSFGGNVENFKADLKEYLKNYINIDENCKEPIMSSMLVDIFDECVEIATIVGDNTIGINHYLTIALSYDNAFSTYYFLKNSNLENPDEFIKKLSEKMGIRVLPTIDELEKMNNSNPPIQDILSKIIPIPIGFSGQEGLEQKKSDWKEYVSCLNEEVQKDSYIPLIGRENELQETIAVLLRKNKNNPVHLGDAGVGKTAIAEGLAKLINDGKVPDELIGYKLYSCNMGNLIAGCSLRGEFEERLTSLLEGIKNEKAILYIDEIHTIMSSGGAGSDAANILKPYLSKGEIKVIGATTQSEYRKSIEKDSALERRFSPIIIEQPSLEETEKILLAIKQYYEKFHGCTYSDEIIRSIIHLTDKYINDKYFPDKAIDIMDEAGSYIKLNKIEDGIVTNEIIEDIISKKCNIPRNSVSADEVKQIRELGDNMKSIVIGQDSAIDKINENIVLSRSGLRDNNKPVANLLFVGPTGVGKTYIAQTLADSLGIPLIRKDMSEFTEAHSVSKLFGSPAGYVGYDEGGLLINEIRKTPHCVLLLDEIEKAHPDVYNVFLQIMDNAKLTDSFGKSADFRNVILIMTSNAGAEDTDKRGIGFGAADTNSSAIDNAVKMIFRPEFRNRLDAIIKFNPMSKEMAEKIATTQMVSLSKMLNDKKVSLTYDKSVIDYIVKKGYSKEYGARNIKRVIDNNIKIKLGKEILFGNLQNGGNCNLSFVDDELRISN